MDLRGVPCSPIHNYPEVLQEDQVSHMNLVRDLKLPNGTQTRTTAFPISMSGYEFEIYRSPPTLGENTEEVYNEWMSAQQPGDTS